MKANLPRVTDALSGALRGTVFGCNTNVTVGRDLDESKPPARNGRAQRRLISSPAALAMSAAMRRASSQSKYLLVLIWGEHGASRPF
jgi:hypothetical protein